MARACTEDLSGAASETASMHEFERSQAQNDVHGNGVLRRRCWAAAEFGPSRTSAMPDSLRSPTLARQVEQRAEAGPLSAILISIWDLCPSIVAISDFCTGGEPPKGRTSCRSHGCTAAPQSQIPTDIAEVKPKRGNVCLLADMRIFPLLQPTRETRLAGPTDGSSVPSDELNHPSRQLSALPP
ncbi:uncharacterized protein PAN0_004d2314 [Moesziomyces antarcticus]|uniref:Uncharacterized protein n=2 Tax=Pseudozyma antarctica TaxID=84753 RepID=A0A5C3FKG8_PSEA2|nr:uncharacterized protein PAN0_004d2314 [Moesziomyces antarcticus]GAK64105.1 hypothetical protein PAN0_004d2314 [Moesziomyces antarcticus]SPO44676.1 uncharacterized protein PSANT_02361 [Moesziomyces antarcticus]